MSGILAHCPTVAQFVAGISQESAAALLRRIAELAKDAENQRARADAHVTVNADLHERINGLVGELSEAKNGLARSAQVILANETERTALTAELAAEKARSNVADALRSRITWIRTYASMGEDPMLKRIVEECDLADGNDANAKGKG